MRTILTAFAATVLVAGLTETAQAGHHRHSSQSTRSVTINTDDRDHLFDWDDNTWFEIDDGTVMITHKERGEPRSTVEITEDHELYVDDERIELDPEQKVLVGRFHDDCMDLVDQATKIGIEGAKVGLQGARLGVQAVAGVFKLLLPDYDSDDLDADLEREAAKIEAKAAVLEDKADIIEDMAEELEDQAHEMRRVIPALGNLDWF